MLKTRVIPCLLLKGTGLVKTMRFKDPKYVGDPINAIKIFNDKEVDELVLLDITASREGKGPAFDTIRDIASECFMPVGYGGGIRTLEDIRRILKAGIEKVVLNTAAVETPDLVREAAAEFGAQAVVVSIDARRKLLGRYEVFTRGGTKATGLNPVEHAQRMEELGAGEIFLNAIDRDGTMEGYDTDLIAKVSARLSVPVIAAGGAGDVRHFGDAVRNGADAVAAGAMFVFHGPHRAVLITYPRRADLERALA